MKCAFCHKAVFGDHGITVPGIGPAHLQCYQASLALKRTFKNMEITELSDEELFELKELILTEENSRNRSDDDYDDIELF